METQETKPEKLLEGCLAQIARQPGHAEANAQLFALCRVPEHRPALIAHLRQKLRKQPKDIVAHSLLVYLYEQDENWQPALPHMDVVYRTGAVDHGFYVNYIRALRDNFKVKRAMQMAEEGLAKFPDNLKLIYLRGQLRQMVQDWQGSLSDMTRLATLGKDDLENIYDLGLMKFMVSGMKEGFEEYKSRHLVDKQPPPVLPAPAWKGEDLAGKTLLLVTEQGIGDVIMFLSLLPWVVERCSKVYLVVEERLVSMLQRSFPKVELIAASIELLQNPLVSQVDYYAPLGDLMHYALPHYTPSEHPPYLKPDPARVAELRERYQAIARARGREGAKLIGFSWHTIAKVPQRNLSPDQMAPLMDLPGTQWVSLQYGDHSEALARVNRFKDPNRLYVDPAVDVRKDIEGLCAQMAAMDQVVSIQNATVHFAGALGVPCMIMLSAASNWRWGLGQENRWYESVEILRQPQIYEWNPIISQVKERLKRL